MEAEAEPEAEDGEETDDTCVPAALLEGGAECDALRGLIVDGGVVA